MNPIDGVPNQFFGRARSSTLFEPFVVIVTVMPLAYSPGQFLFSATYNGQLAFSLKEGTVEDLGSMLKSYGVYEDIQIWREGRAERGLKRAIKENTDDDL